MLSKTRTPRTRRLRQAAAAAVGATLLFTAASPALAEVPATELEARSLEAGPRVTAPANDLTQEIDCDRLEEITDEHEHDRAVEECDPADDEADEKIVRATDDRGPVAEIPEEITPQAVDGDRTLEQVDGTDVEIGPALDAELEQVEDDSGGFKPLNGDPDYAITNVEVGRHAHSLDISLTTSEPVNWVGAMATPTAGGPTKVGLGLNIAAQTSWMVTVPLLSPGTQYKLQLEVPTGNGPVISYTGTHSTLSPNVSVQFKKVVVHSDSDPGIAGCGEFKFQFTVSSAWYKTGEYCIDEPYAQVFGTGITLTQNHLQKTSQKVYFNATEYDPTSANEFAEKYTNIDLHSPHQSDSTWSKSFTMNANDGDELNVTLHATATISYG